MRRAATAEADAEKLRLTVEEAQKQAKDLGWQVNLKACILICMRISVADGQ